jgi:PRC-barrel domain
MTVARMTDCRGWTVYSSDRVPVGSVNALVQSRAAGNAEYFIVGLSDGATVLVPVAYARLNQPLKRVTLRALPASGCRVLPLYNGQPLTEGLEDQVWWVFVTAEEAKSV